ncbi:MAG: hypothetical protein V4621_04455 [Pseudomonadota bacterium]
MTQSQNFGPVAALAFAVAACGCTASRSERQAVDQAASPASEEVSGQLNIKFQAENQACLEWVFDPKALVMHTQTCVAPALQP